MSSFVQTIRPCPFGFFDSDATYQVEADALVTFVKRKLGDDVIDVELTSKQIWLCFEEATCEYGKFINESQIRGELANILGTPTGSVDYTNKYPRKTLEFLARQAEPYASWAGTGGAYDMPLGYFDLEGGRQDYNIYTELKRASDGALMSTVMPTGFQGKLRVVEIFHPNPIAAQAMLLNASNITNFLATEFNYESYVNSTVFYVLPVFEDVLRRQMLETANRVRRSNYSYEIKGSNVRIYPTPSTLLQLGRMYMQIAMPQDPLTPGFTDNSIYGVSGPSNAPFSNVPYGTINSWGRQWIRQYTFALCREMLGLVYSKIKSIPIPGSELTLDGPELVAQGREDKEKLRTELRDFLLSVSQPKLMEQEAATAENIAKQLKYTAVPTGHWITTG